MARLLFDEPLSEELCEAVADIWIRLGNCTTGEIAQLWRRRHAEIVRFNEQHEATVLELG